MKEAKNNLQNASEDLNSLFGSPPSKENKKILVEEIEDVSDDLNSLFGEVKPEKEEFYEREDTSLDYLENVSNFEKIEVDGKESYTFRLTEEEKRELIFNTKQKDPYRSQSGLNKVLSFIKEHIRPDIGLEPFKEGEGIKVGEDDLSDIGRKIKENLRIGLKFTMKW